MTCESSHYIVERQRDLAIISPPMGAMISNRTPSLADYLGPLMRERLDRSFHKPIT